MEACKYSECSAALKNCTFFCQNLWAFRWENYALNVDMSSSFLARDPNPEQLLRVWKCATCDFLIAFSSRRMQSTWSPDQTVWSSRRTQSRNSLFFSSSKVNLIFCVCFLPDEATKGQRLWSRGYCSSISVLHTHRKETLEKYISIDSCRFLLALLT